MHCFNDFKLNHIGILANKWIQLESLIPKNVQNKIIYDENFDVELLLIKTNNANYEYIVPKSPNSLLYKQSKNKINAINHFCYEVHDLKWGVEFMSKNGFINMSKAVPAKLFAFRKVQFFINSMGLIVELLEVETQNP